MLCWFLPYTKVDRLHVHIYPLLSEPPSHYGHQPTLSRAPCAIQEVLTSYLFYCLVTQSCPTLCNLVDCSLPGSPVLGISQARILEWVAISTPRDLPDPGMNLSLLCLLHWQVDSLPMSHLGSPLIVYIHDLNSLLVPRFPNQLIAFPPSESSCYLSGVGHSPLHLGSLIFFCGYSTLPTTSNLIFLKHHVPSCAAPFQVPFPTLSSVYASLCLPKFW